MLSSMTDEVQRASLFPVPPPASANGRTVEDVIRELTKGSCIPYERDAFGAWWATFVRWPPDVFALTSVLLAESGAYRLAASPPHDAFEPCADREGWLRRVGDACGEWRAWIAASFHPRMPTRLSDIGDAMHAALDSPARALAKDKETHAVCSHLLTLHAMADEACHTLGVPDRAKITPEEEPLAAMRLHAELTLAARGTLSFLATDRIRVLPKLRTPQVGISLRSLSHHLAIQRSEVEVGWSVHPGGMHRLDRPGPMRINLLIVPWPFELHSGDFQEVSESRGDARVGAFTYEPRAAENVAQEVRAAVESARRAGPTVDGVVLPESALTDDEYSEVAAVLRELDVPFLLSGVRGPRSNSARLALQLGKEDPLPWHIYEQPKHHRWCVDANQIYQYHLGATLHPGKLLWEDIDIRTRSINFVALNSWLTLCHLICEDLARLDPVSEVVRAVGPNLVIALLLDGPQLEPRWPGRYASVLADDPGSSVLTVTSLGLVKRCTPKGHPPSRVVALWKDSRRGAHELALAPDANGLLVTLCGSTAEEFTADGRPDKGTAGVLVLGGVEQVRWRSPSTIGGPKRSTPKLKPAKKRADITALCFLTDALVSAPKQYVELIRLARESTSEIKEALDELQSAFAVHATKDQPKAACLAKVRDELQTKNTEGARVALGALDWSTYGRL